MNVSRLVALVSAAALTACKSDAVAPASESFTAPLVSSSVVPAATSSASGSATFTVASDSTLSFSLTLTGITGVTQAHLHTGAAGANGATLVWLLPANGTSAQTPSVDLTGVVAEGVIDRTWIRGTTPISLDSLKSLMRLSKAYVDVHTSVNAAGELRGQITRK